MSSVYYPYDTVYEATLVEVSLVTDRVINTKCLGVFTTYNEAFKAVNKDISRVYYGEARLVWNGSDDVYGIEYWDVLAEGSRILRHEYYTIRERLGNEE